MATIAGVDGGGTRTRIVVADLATGRLAFAQCQGTNPRIAEPQEAAAAIASGVRQALAGLVMGPRAAARETADCVDAYAAPGDAAPAIEAVCVALAGAGRPAAAERMRLLLSGALRAERVAVVTDAAAALAAHVGPGAGVVLVAGTGSIALGDDGEGSVWRAGGYGYLVGDEGSGFWLGRAGLAAALRAFDGRGPKTRLLCAALECFAVTEPPALVDVLYGSSNAVRDIAAFAKVVLDLRSADPVAERIVEEALAEHALLVKSVWTAAQERLGRSVAVTGGLYRGRAELAAELGRHLPGAVVQTLATAPCLGALRLAARYDSELSQAVNRFWDAWKSAGRNWA